MNTNIMGVLNVTPDSFSDGGKYFNPETALAHARELVSQGATIIDVGGESTRPGADRVHPDEEQSRVLPVIAALTAEGIAVSIDTVNASTAKLAVAAGASVINDVSGGTADPEMLRVAAETGATLVLMHWRGIPDPQHNKSGYHDVVSEVRAELAALAGSAIAAGVQPDKIILDPGLGFDKTAAQGWQLLGQIDQIASLGYPLLIGISRKRMLRETLPESASDPLDLARLDGATATVSAFMAGVWGVRVHAVRASADAIAIAAALQTGAAKTPVSNSTEAVASAATQSDGFTQDRITLTGLEVFAHHGVFDFEREQGQSFFIDADISVDLRAAAAGDELAATVHYGELADAILAAVKRDPVDLIETLAERVAQVALSYAAVREARITVHKPDAPIDAKFADVSVTIVRRRGDAR
ncbi:dihydropteroate synthase [Leucobacter sp. UT-8R-CII-1-4]|uniref:dihydropteroate synthase n=1 Tax=Leucobacter sp. UT-8R-CII-1-4 TaxID=3040075 RepID=UPI0024A8BA8E|nr:dihydropteroate synthase [Leucobacter sp. UT-8R-CII-1-4]MDI6022467.1 dihydropteroate synthase [Leucobacter sp. UT-8R-CII-1-4]